MQRGYECDRKCCKLKTCNYFMELPTLISHMYHQQQRVTQLVKNYCLKTDLWQSGTTLACLGGKAGGSGGVGEQSLLRVVSGHVPGRTGCGIKVIMPMLVKCVIGVSYGVDQTIVQHLGGTCRGMPRSQHIQHMPRSQHIQHMPRSQHINTCQGVSTCSTCQ